MRNLKQLIEHLEDVFEKEKQINMRRFGKEYRTFDKKDYRIYHEDGYIDSILQIPFASLLTIEFCEPKDEKNYLISIYSACPYPRNQKVFLFDSSIEDSRLHRHDYYELIYVYKGHRCMQVEDKTLRLEEHDICIFDMQCAHLDLRMQSEGIAFYCCITKGLVDAYFLRCLKNKKIRNFFSVQGHLKNNVSYLQSHADGIEYSKIEKNLEMIFAEMEEAAPGYDHIVQVETARILNNFVDNNTVIYTFDKRLNGSKSFQAVARYINSNISDINIEKLCAQFHYQEDYFCRLIKKNTGLTYSEYVHVIRMDKAKNLLVNTDMSVSDILTYLGYQSHSSFYKYFQETNGITPITYRKKKKALQ